MIVKCPTCGKSVVWDETSPFRPFCSERCKLIDLGAWAEGAYVIETKGEDVEDEATRQAKAVLAQIRKD